MRPSQKVVLLQIQCYTADFFGRIIIESASKIDAMLAQIGIATYPAPPMPMKSRSDSPRVSFPPRLPVIITKPNVRIPIEE